MNSAETAVLADVINKFAMIIDDIILLAFLEMNIITLLLLIKLNILSGFFSKIEMHLNVAYIIRLMILKMMNSMLKFIKHILII